MGPPRQAAFNVCFCDIDGTLVHYPESQAKWGENWLQSPVKIGVGQQSLQRISLMHAGEITGPSVVPGCFMYVARVGLRRASACISHKRKGTYCNVRMSPQETGKRHKVLKLPPTTTGYQVGVQFMLANSGPKSSWLSRHANLIEDRWHALQGVISVKTLTELDRMRKGGVKLVLITGARLSTLLTRMAFLPAADAYVCENGGRIYYPASTLAVALPIAEDMEWRRKHNATGCQPALQQAQMNHLK